MLQQKVSIQPYQEGRSCRGQQKNGSSYRGEYDEWGNLDIWYDY